MKKEQQSEVRETVDTTENLNEQMQIRLEKLEGLEAEGCKPFTVRTAEQSHHAAQIIDDFASLEGQKVVVAGRMMSKRGMGKVSFSDLQDRSGTVQIFSKIDLLGEEAYRAWLNLDIGDLVEVHGEVFRTKRGEISVRSESYRLLAKCLRPLPEKFHGLTDKDTRYRKRYLDLIVNPEVKTSFEKRSRIISAVRSYLNQHDFLEVETPLLNIIAGGASARPFITHHNSLDLDLFLRISPELYLKRLIVGGFERVYELGRNFRNEGMSVRHNPEFTMLELYEAYTDYKGMMEICENIIADACRTVNAGECEISFNGQEIDLTPPFRRVSMAELVEAKTGVDFTGDLGLEEAKAVAEKAGLAEQVTAEMGRGDILNLLFEELCEAELIQPTFVYDYPIEISPLTKKKPEDPRFTERFELFISGMEFANAYSELNDPRDQKERFQEQLRRRQAGDDEANLPDQDFVEALEYAMPPTGGLGIGIDRLVMLLTDNSSIRDVLLFPTMKPLGDKTTINQASDGASSESSESPAAELEKIDFSKVKVEALFEDMIDFETFIKSDYRAVKVLNCEEVPKSKKLLKFTLNDGSEKERVILSGIKEYYQPEELIGKTLLAICNLPPRKMMGIESEGMLISAIHEEEGEERLNLITLSPRIPAGAKMY